MEGDRVSPGLRALVGPGARCEDLGAPMPPVDFALAPGATGPAGALAGVNTKELQGELPKADRWSPAKRRRRGDRGATRRSS